MRHSTPTNAPGGVPLLGGLREIADRYDVVLSDIWGVVHNGREHFPRACDALREFRARGGTVVLVTNAPRPFPPILEQLALLGAPRDCFDEVVTSGDVTLAFVTAHGDRPVHHIGPPRDHSFFDIMERQVGHCPPRADLEQAHYVLCTGLFEDDHTPDMYDDMIARMRARDMELICANPDLIVHVGDKEQWCAGALAQRYEEAGGRVLQAGKPFAPIYDRAIELAQARRAAPIDPSRVLAIGDAIRTDIQGAMDKGFDAVFVTSGIHRDELHPQARPGNPGDLDRAALDQLLARTGVRPAAALPALTW